MTTRPTPLVRPFRTADRDAILAILTTSEPWRTLGYADRDWNWIGNADDGRETYVVDEDGRAIGVATVRRRFLAGEYLELFAIAAAARRRGIGRLLLEHVEDIVFSRARNFFLCVSDFNASGRAFYQTLGYQEVGRLDNLLVQGSAEILMRKTAGGSESLS